MSTPSHSAMPLAPPPAPVPLLTVADAAWTHPRLHADPDWARVRTGVYAPHAGWLRLAPWERYLARVHAFALTHPHAVFCHESAAALWRLPLFGEPRDIHVLDERRPASRRFGDVAVHTTADAVETVQLGPMRVTSAPATAVALMRVLPPAYALAVGDAAVSPVQGGATRIDDLGRLLDAQIDSRGRRRAQRVLSLVDPRAESPGESVSRAVIAWLGFCAPELQVVFAEQGYEDRVDFFWRGVRVIAESDGFDKYVGVNADDTVARVMAEKRREDRLRAQSRAFVRWEWADVMRIAPLEARLARAGVPRVARPQPLLLATVGRNPRSLPRARNHSRDEKPRTT